MLSEKTKAAVNDILYNIAAAQTFVLSTSLQEFESDLKTLYATTRALEIVCETCVRLPDDLKSRHPKVSWRDIRDAGNFYRHSYDNVAASFILKTVRDYLPSLASVAQMELNADQRDIPPEGTKT